MWSADLRPLCTMDITGGWETEGTHRREAVDIAGRGKDHEEHTGERNEHKWKLCSLLQGP